VSFLILRAFYNLRGMLDRMLVEHGLDEWVQAGMGPILYALYEQDDCTIREIGERVLLAPSTLTNTLKRMEKNGLVSMAKDENDRRAMRVRLTPRARKLQADMCEMRGEVQRVLHGEMSDRQVQQAISLLSQMIESLDVHEWESKHPRNKARR
jgi:DNA-binding MarR family transcriptional regulator